MEQATDGAETAAINGLVSSWSENISVSFCLRAPGYRLTLWCALGLLVGGAIQVPQLQLQLKANSAFHPSGVGKWVPASAGKAKAGITGSFRKQMYAECAGKTATSLENACYTWAP